MQSLSDLKEQWKSEYLKQGIPSSFRNDPSNTVVSFIGRYKKTTSNVQNLAADLGCGRGRNSLYLANQGFSVVSLDLLEENANHVSKLAQSLNLPIIAHAQDVADTWKVSSHSLDLAIDIFCYKHLKDKAKQKNYRKELHRTLKNEGYYFISCASDKDGFYGPLLKNSAATPHKLIVDPISQIPSYLYSADDLYREFSDYFDLVFIEERASESPMHKKVYSRAVLNAIFQKKKPLMLSLAHVPAPKIEAVYSIPVADKNQALKNHFSLFYRHLVKGSIYPQANMRETKDLHSFTSGSLIPFHNMVIGVPPQESWNETISEQLSFFSKDEVPFFWCVDENAHPGFEQALHNHGFQNAGIFRGVTGPIDPKLISLEIPSGCSLELVQDEETFIEFNDLVCSTFSLEGEGKSKDFYKTSMWLASKDTQYPMFHWIARREGKVVSAVSTLIEKDMVSFWNGATLPSERRQGVSTALRKWALMHAMANGARQGSSFLMSDGMALGICTKLGFQTKWRFSVYISPSSHKK